MSSVKWRPICFGCNVLTWFLHYIQVWAPEELIYSFIWFFSYIYIEQLSPYDSEMFTLGLTQYCLHSEAHLGNIAMPSGFPSNIWEYVYGWQGSALFSVCNSYNLQY